MDPFDAVSRGDVAALRDALAADPAAAASRNASGASLLAWAAYMRNPDAVASIRDLLPAIDPYEACILGEKARIEAALADGWDASALSPDGFTPLGLAAFFNEAEVFDLLLPLTRDVNQRAENSQRVAALHAATAARNAAMVERLLRAGADPNLAQADGFTPIHVAAQHGDAAITGLLVLFGASPTHRNSKGQNAIDHARSGGHEWLAARLEALA